MIKESDADRAALLVPGRGYGVHRPLFTFVDEAVQRRGGYVHGMSWSPPDIWEFVTNQPWVCAEVTAALETLATARPAARTPVLVGKSLGTLAAPVAADRGLPAIWLTPLLHEDAMIPPYRAATAPFLLVGGTADPSWRGGLARELTPHVLEIDGADHGMLIPGPLAGSARVLGEVATAVERFLDEVVWP